MKNTYRICGTRIDSAVVNLLSSDPFLIDWLPPTHTSPCFPAVEINSCIPHYSCTKLCTFFFIDSTSVLYIENLATTLIYEDRSSQMQSQKVDSYVLSQQGRSEL